MRNLKNKIVLLRKEIINNTGSSYSYPYIPVSSDCQSRISRAARVKGIHGLRDQVMRNIRSEEIRIT